MAAQSHCGVRLGGREPPPANAHPCTGSEYSNIFVHYRPLGKPLWFTDKDVGREAPAIAHLFRPEDAETHDVGLVGEDAAKAFPFSGKDEL
jgi:hypothetical protein